jgi:hypothetical protein
MNLVLDLLVVAVLVAAFVAFHLLALALALAMLLVHGAVVAFRHVQWRMRTRHRASDLVLKHYPQPRRAPAPRRLVPPAKPRRRR